jgi:histidinol-phosphate phosphatase family protein
MADSARMPAIFLDRDGTLIEDLGAIGDPKQVRFLPGVVEALRRLQDEFALFVVTHQPWLARGVLKPAEVERVNRYIVGHLATQGVSVREVYVCPHERSEGCPCMKPKPHAPAAAARKWNLDLSRSFAVGDHAHDVELGRNMGGRGIFVLTGHGAKHRDEIAKDVPVATGLAQAADLILALARRRAGTDKP